MFSLSLPPSPTSRELASGQEAPPTMPHLLNLDLSDGREEKVPSESDVQDILTSAHAPHTARWVPCTPHSQVGPMHHLTARWVPCTTSQPGGSHAPPHSQVGPMHHLTARWVPCTPHSQVGPMHTTQPGGLVCV